MKRGFTLIELLAVIVILAIIALIAVPIVVNIINEAKNSSDEESVKLYEDAVQKTIVRKQMQDPSFKPSVCDIQTDGNLKCISGTEIVDVVVEVTGKTPESGVVTIEGNKISLKNVKCNDKIYYERGILIDDADNNNEISVGDKYTYKVKDKETFNFYVLSIEGDKINLIMDRNICEDGTVNYTYKNNYCLYTWYDDGDDPVNYNNDMNSFGPVTAMTTLANATREWNNVPNMNLEYNDTENNNTGTYGYTGVTITNGVGYIIKKDGTTQIPINVEGNLRIKARLPKFSEVTGANSKCTSSSGSCEPFLIENLRYENISNDKYSVNSSNISGTAIYNISGYWLLLSSSNQIGVARSIYNEGRTGYNYTSVMHGVRAVITVSKADLSS